MSDVRYIEVNARDFLLNFAQILSNKELMNEIVNDEHYIFRFYSNAIEFGYHDDKPLIIS